MKKYRIVQTNLLNIVLAECPTLEFAENYLKEMEERDKYLQMVCGWTKLPEYKIIEVEVEED